MITQVVQVGSHSATPSSDQVNENEIRKAWLTELLRAGILTCHTQTLCDDDKYDYLTVPAFKLLSNLAKKYRSALEGKGILVMPEWYTETVECLEVDGGSPRQMQVEMMKCLNVKKD